ncbi:MAG: cation:proton antiporter [Bdellovibrionales bacterium]
MSDPSRKSFSESLKEVVRALAALAVVVFAFWRMGLLNNPDPMGGRLFALGFLVLAGTAGGRIAALIGLPRLTGYLAAGLISGPSVCGLVTKDQAEGLRLINGLALALIALQAGCEFTNSMLRRNFRSLMCGTLGHTVVMGLGMTAVVFFTVKYLEVFPGLDWRGLLAVAAMFAVVAVSKSPAAVVAVIGETRSRGELTDHALGIVVILDVLVLALFSIVLLLARNQLGGAATEMDFDELKHLGVELIASVAAGSSFGLLIITYFKFIARERLLFVAAAAYGITAFCRYFGYDTMLVFVVAGYIVTNVSRQGEPLIHTIESMSSVVMIVFFATAGASLHIEEIVAAWQLALVVFTGRAALTWTASRVGHILAKDTGVVRGYGFTPFVSQAGLSLGLAIIISERLPGLGHKLSALIIAVIAVNEIVGPALFKWGLHRAGEIGQRDLAPQEKESHPSPT